MVDRVSSGIAGLDELIEGGFPRGNLILLSGPPGSGKTVFGFQFLYEGITKLGETGLFLTFLESKESFFSNFRHLGFDLDALEKTDRFKFMSMTTTKEEGISDSLKVAMDDIRDRKVTLLVIDSFTAMKEAFTSPIEARIVLNTILGRMVRLMGCTTLLIDEKSGGEKAGIGMEEFVADGVIRLESFMDRLEIRRRVLITKMRGTNHSLKYQGVIIGESGMRLTPIVG
jgi:circadian clock protein KaiC